MKRKVHDRPSTTECAGYTRRDGMDFASTTTVVRFGGWGYTLLRSSVAVMKRRAGGVMREMTVEEARDGRDDG